MGIAVLVIAFGLVAQVEDGDPAWRIAVVLALSVVLFLGCALFSIRLARAAFLTWRRARDRPAGAHDAPSRRERSPARDDRAD